MHLKVSFVIALVIMTMVCAAQAGVEHLMEKRRSPHGRPYRDYSIRLQAKTFCPLNPEIDLFLKQLKGLMQKRISVRRGNTIIWPFNCLYAATNFEKRIFEVDIHACCLKCEHPGFSQCVSKYYSDGTAEPRCNKEAIQCIAKCLPKGKSCSGHRPSSSCHVTEKVIGKMKCEERSCIAF